MSETFHFLIDIFGQGKMRAKERKHVSRCGFRTD